MVNRACSHYKSAQVYEADFSPLLGSDDDVCPKAHKEELTRKCGNISRKDACSLVGTRPNVSIAILDTGVAPVEDLGRRGRRVVAAVDFVNGKKHPYDEGAVILGLMPSCNL